MTPTGKIGRLPHPVREHLNLRLLDNQPSDTILTWLHAQPEVQAILQEQFDGTPVTKQNLSEWRHGAFAAWQLRREVICCTQDPDAELKAGKGVRIRPHAALSQLTENLATVLAGRYASLLVQWDGEVTPAFSQKLRSLGCLCRDISALRRADHSVARLQLEQDKVEVQGQKNEEETVTHFMKWLERPDICQLAMSKHLSHEERATKLKHRLWPATIPPAAPTAPAIVASSPVQPNPPPPGVGTARPHVENEIPPQAPAHATPPPPVQTGPTKSTPVVAKTPMPPPAPVDPPDIYAHDQLKPKKEILPGDPGSASWHQYMKTIVKPKPHYEIPFYTTPAGDRFYT